jgi:hypothetical protein
MTGISTRGFEKALYLTEEEANSLLEMCLLSQTDLTADRAVVMQKIVSMCRDYMRQPGRGGSGSGLQEVALAQVRRGRTRTESSHEFAASA